MSKTIKFKLKNDNSNVSDPIRLLTVKKNILTTETKKLFEQPKNKNLNIFQF